MTPAYMTVFDRTAASPIEIWSPVFFGFLAVAFAVVLWFKRESMMPNRSDSGRVVVAGLIIWMSVGWTATATYRIGTGEYAIKNAMRDQKVEAVEGYITTFKPRFANGEFPEKFCVQQRCFSYFDYLPSSGFHTSNVVEKDMLVRFWCVGNNIIRLDVVPMPKRQQPAGPPPGVGME